MSIPDQLTIVRGRQRLPVGSLRELVGLATKGKLKPNDRISGLIAAGPVPIHDIAELARLVPTPREYLVTRSLRSLVMFDVVIGSFLVLLLVAAVANDDHDPSMLRVVIFGTVFFLAMFGLPVITLNRQRQELVALRQRGITNGVFAGLNPADKAWRDFLTRKAWGTRVLVIFIVGVFGLSLLMPDHWFPEHFAKINDNIRAGEAWRLFTPLFLHAGFGHLLFNSFALAEFGRVIENLYGWRRAAVIFFAAGVAGNIASFVAVPQASVGASGGIFGLMGAMLVFGLRNKQILPAAARRRFTREIALCIGINLALGFLATFIDNAAHIGGLVVGMVLATSFQVQPDAAALSKLPTVP